MFERKRKTKAPCQGCFMHLDRCFCDLIPKIITKTRLSLVIYKRELKRTTNTGRLAVKALKNSELLIRGLQNDPLDLTESLDPKYEPLLLYPTDEAELLTPDFVRQMSKPVQLLVPDGNWRQATKVNLRHPELKNVKRVKIAKQNLDSSFMRAESKDNGMATLQAIAYAMGVLEGVEVEKKLLDLYYLKLNRTLMGRGKF